MGCPNPSQKCGGDGSIAVVTIVAVPKMGLEQVNFEPCNI